MQHNASRQFFQKVKGLNKKLTPRTRNIKAKDGTLLTETKEIKERWKEFTEELYCNTDKNPHPTIVTPSGSEEPSILLEEVEAALRKIKNNKSPGIDGIPAELLKASGEAGLKALLELCNKIWTTGVWPEDWITSVFITLPKKGDLGNCDNYRTISLISHASKILLYIILNRLQQKVDMEIPEEQAGFRKGRGTRDQIFNLNLLLQKNMGVNKPIYIAFIDYRKAFDSVSHQKMSQTLLDMGFPAHIVALIQSLYSSQQASVQVAGELTEKFDVKRGARQGCILSPALFNTYSEQIMRNAMADNQTGTSIGGRKISDLRYADDVAILAESKEGLQSILQKISNESKLFDLHMKIECKEDQSNGMLKKS